MKRKHLNVCTEFGTIKKVIFHPLAKKQIRSFDEKVRYELGFLIFRLQKGDVLKMPFSRSLSASVLGIYELRVRDRSGQYRVIYFYKNASLILVLHAFMKKTQKTPLEDIELAITRLKNEDWI